MTGKTLEVRLDKKKLKMLLRLRRLTEDISFFFSSLVFSEYFGNFEHSEYISEL